eukprot:945780-Rhodomonas_salina.1
MFTTVYTMSKYNLHPPMQARGRTPARASRVNQTHTPPPQPSASSSGSASGWYIPPGLREYHFG